MNPNFQQLVESLEPRYRALLASSPFKYSSLPRPLPKRGIYLFSDGGQHLYVGRTNHLRQRLAGHCRPSSTHFSATFAFRIAREQSGRLKASYTRVGSRPELLLDPEFAAAFITAKVRLGTLDIRFIEETDPVRQALLEIYVATVLRTPYNDFENH
jgi:hypothetical protein